MISSTGALILLWPGYHHVLLLPLYDAGKWAFSDGQEILVHSESNGMDSSSPYRHRCAKL